MGNKAQWETAYVVSNPLVSFIGCCLNNIKKIKKEKKEKEEKRKDEEENQGKVVQGVKNSYDRKNA